MAHETIKTFGAALRELLVEHDYVTAVGKPNWSAFVSELEGFHYDTLRKAVTGERRPSPSLLVECARALRLRPEYFVEYRIYLAQRDFDPDAVGLERVLRNLRAWFAAKSSREQDLRDSSGSAGVAAITTEGSAVGTEGDHETVRC